MKQATNASAPLSDNSTETVAIGRPPNPLIQNTIPETLSKTASALHEVKRQFVFDGDDIGSVQISVSLCESIADILGQVIDATQCVENQSKEMCTIYAKLLKDITRLCDNTDQLMAAQQFYYLAVETIFQKRKVSESDEYGTSLFSRWLYEEGINALDETHRIQSLFRDMHYGTVKD